MTQRSRLSWETPPGEQVVPDDAPTFRTVGADDCIVVVAARGLPALADPGYEGAGHLTPGSAPSPPNSRTSRILTPVKKSADGHALPINNHTINMLLRSMRCLGKRGFALLTQRWRVLQHITQQPRKIGDIARAALVLTHFEHGYSSR